MAKDKSVGNAVFEFTKPVAATGTNPAVPGLAKLEVDGIFYEWENASGKFRIPKGAQNSGQALQGDKLAQAITKAFEEVKERKNLTPLEFDHLVDIVKQNKTPLAARADALRSMRFVDDAVQLRSAVQSPYNKELYIKLMAKGEDAAKRLIPNSEIKAFMTSLGKEAENISETISTVKGLSKEIVGKTFSDEPKVAKKELSEILAKYHSKDANLNEIKKFIPDEVNEHLSGSTLPEIGETIAKFTGKVTSSKSELTRMAVGRNNLVQDIETTKKKWLPDPQKVARLERQLVAHDEKVVKFLEEDVAHGAGFKMLDETIQDSLKKSSSISAAIGKATTGVGTAVKEAGKAADGAKRGLWAKVSEYTVTENKLNSVAAKDGISFAEAEAKIGKVGKFRGLKALGAGAVVIGGAVAAVSAFGNKGPGPRAEAEMQRREQEPAMAGGRA